MALKNKPNELYITRIYNAPVKAVWDAWTDPAQAAQWWGPRGHSIKTHSKDLRVGGKWHYTMFGPAGEEWINKTIYHEVEIGKKLVYDHGGNDEREPLFRVTVTFEELPGQRTKMDMTMAMKSAEAAAETKKFIKKARGNSTWDRLAEFVEKGVQNREVFVINRSFTAPIETVFEMFVKPENLSRWLAPTGMEMRFIRTDIRPSGQSFFVMEGENGTMYGRINYLKIDRPKNFVYTQEFADETGNLAKHPGLSTWPTTMMTVVHLEAEETGETRVTLTWSPHGDVASEELRTFIEMRSSMTEGWMGSFDKLEDLLAKV